MVADAVLIRGPVGVGKTTTAAGVSDMLMRRAVPHGAMDLDWLCAGYPHLGPYNNPMRYRNAAVIAAEYRKIGAKRFVLAGVVEDREELEHLADAVGVDELLVCDLRAPIEVIHERLRARDTGDSLRWHLDRAVVLADQLANDGLAHLTVDTQGKDHVTVAIEIIDRIGWRT